MRARSPRILLLWPGTTGAAAGNFGVPQLVTMATYVRARTGAEVHVRDLVCERALAGGRVDLDRLFDGEDGRGHAVIGISVYSSYDALLCEELARIARARCPDAVIVAGGYHASAVPEEFTRDGSPFDICVVGEGEHALARIVETVAGGVRPDVRITESEPVEDLDTLPPTDWSFLDRYRGVARKVASQTQVYLSRGCPFDCSFCMERAKREVSWRAYSVDRAVDEVLRLDHWLDLRGWTLYVADALFGMKTSWRRAFLEKLARAGVRAEKLWLLTRVDLLEDTDLALFGDANCGLGFGLESGDPEMLGIIRKSGRLDDYLDRMRHVSRWARTHDVPWGANVIVGHPGETEGSMRRSAEYLRGLFLDGEGTTGFLSVDPFRLYPGSPIDRERADWEQRFGTRFHRPRWWRDGDPAFLSEWIDPSASLFWSRREALQHELFTPILEALPSRFTYRGRAADYFRRAIDHQIALTRPRARFPAYERFSAWHAYLRRVPQGRATRLRQTGLVETASALRVPEIARACARADVSADHPSARALARVPREWFVPLDQVAASLRDEPVPLDDSGRATVSAMHAYLLTYGLAEIGAGQRVLDLGAGTGYGTALLAEIVGERGRVVGVEVDPRLVEAGAPALARWERAQLVAGDARRPETWPMRIEEADRIVGGFAWDVIPEALLARMKAGAIFVAPVARDGSQFLVKVERNGDGPGRDRVTWHTEVRYVGIRDAPAAPPAEPAEDADGEGIAVRDRKRLTVVR